ncbi:hypothetical protein MOQ_004905 [Trypanosoma cruzi marinkellei]|uniref:Uncharacterized protein n=1 Tax=Trypanosoma cruzi marinkellei TaxID=85056 RepID=K2NQT1_TRYCR|nr:hypothetical protein MOQ_004905 [Trypanosoma cruzi marinkellei]
MDAKPAAPLGLVRQRQNANMSSSLAPKAPAYVKKRPSAQRRAFSPLPEADGKGSSKQGPDGGLPATTKRRELGEAKTMLSGPRVATPLLNGNKNMGNTTERKMISGDGEVSQPSLAKLNQRSGGDEVAGAIDCKPANGRCGMRELRIARHGPTKGVVSKPSAPASCEAVTPTAETAAFCSTKQAEFEKAIDTLNSMMEIDAKNIDPRAWVTLFTEGKAEARLSKEHLLPVWIIVHMNFVMAIDMNGTAQHCNYGNFSASQATSFPPCGCIVFPLQDALREGEVRLPENLSDVEAMMMPATSEIRWGVPVGVLFMNPHERISVVRNICQLFLPLFFREAYPQGVPLRGVWIPAALDATPRKSCAINIPVNVRECVLSCMRDLGISNGNAFTGDGSRLGGTQRRCEVQQRESAPPKLTVATSLTTRHGSGLTPEEQKLRGSSQSKDCDLATPWGSRGNQPIFTARLLTSSAIVSSPECCTPCYAVLVFTPRGLLELVAESPSAAVTVKDVKMSLLRSGLGRSLRLQRDAVRFLYAPSLPVIEDDALINARYVVMRLQTR